MTSLPRPPRTVITATGSWLPPRVVTNKDMEALVDTTDEWIRTRTGIRERRRADGVTGAADMGAKAAQVALARAGQSASDVDVLLVSTATPDRLLPSTACEVQSLIGAEGACAYDIASACSGFIYGLRTAEGHIAAGHARVVLLICTEKMSSIIDPDDRATCVLFGDGAAAAVVQAADTGGHALLSSYARSDGRLADLLHRPAGGARAPMTPRGVAAGDHFVKMSGPGVFKHAVEGMCEAASIAVERAGCAFGDIDLLLPHQANIRIIEATARHINIPMERVMVAMDRHGNMSSASIPVALDEALAEGRITPGSTVLMVAAGAGLTWAGAVLRVGD